MSGETERQISGWTTDTLRTFIVDSMREHDRRYEQRFEAQEHALEVALEQHDRRVDQRFDSQEKAMELAAENLRNTSNERDHRYEQRFNAQQHAVEIALEGDRHAVKTALDAVNKEFHEHLLQVRDETRNAFEASEKAILKAESATDKRFEGVNEFRAQLSDQAGTFMPRLEADSKLVSITSKLDTALFSLTEKIEGINKQTEARLSSVTSTQDTRMSAMVSSISQIASRIDRTEGKSTGLDAGWKYLIGGVSLLLTVLAIVATILAIV